MLWRFSQQYGIALLRRLHCCSDSEKLIISDLFTANTVSLTRQLHLNINQTLLNSFKCTE